MTGNCVLSDTALRGLEFHRTRLDLEVLSGDAVVAEALDFLGTHFAARRHAAAEGAEPVALLRVSLAGQPSDDAPPAPGPAADEIYVRKSASDFFTVPARRERVDGLELVECTRTGTRMAFDRAAGMVRIQVTERGAMDLVELIRDLTLKAEENAGAAVLHATAAERDGRTVLVAGSKGAGKSTVLLELVEHFGYRIMSGDKAIASLDESGLYVTGWPDYPHLGYGTIAKYPGLREIAGIGADYVPAPEQAFSPLGKFAVAPEPFRRRFPGAPRGLRAPVAAIVYPSIGPGDETLLAPADNDVPTVRATLESAFDGRNAFWHRYLDDRRAAASAEVNRTLAALAEIPAFSLTGPGDLTVDPLAAPTGGA
ncbi:MAG TPA: hypothetical protein VH372_09545 [Actinospica sp.]|nr:hypothetical protein [Actinospica sp.]